MPSGGGLLQLVAVGKQDIYLTGNPQMSFFKMVYRRHTNFAIESMPMYFEGTPNFGTRCVCTVPRRGDLLGRIYLQVTLPQLTLQSTGELVSYCNSVGFALIQDVTLEIGEQQIDKQTGEWMEIWTQLTTPAGQRDALNAMVGRVDGYSMPNIIPAPNGMTLYIPLQFWFCRNPGLYLPLLALQYNPIRIRFTLAPLQNLFWTGDLVNTPNCTDNPTVNPVAPINMMLWGDYVFLDTDERRTFVKNSHEYLIEQVQYTKPISIKSQQLVANIPVEFTNPIKEFIVLVQRKDMQSYNEYFNYSNLAVGETLALPIPPPLSNGLAPGQTRTDLISDAVLQLDGYNRFEPRDPTYFRLVQPYEHHTYTPIDNYIYCYSFSLRPEDAQPTGSLNASRIDRIVWQITMNTDLNVPGYFSVGDCTVNIYAINHNIFRVIDGFGGLLFTV